MHNRLPRSAIGPALDPTDHPGFWFDEENTPWRPRRLRRGIYGTARLARRADLEPLLAPAGDGPCSGLPFYAALVEAGADGADLEPILWGALHLPDEVRGRHLLAVGQTGCGKTTRLVYPLLAADLAQRRTVIAVDAKGQKLLPLVERLVAHHRPGCPVRLLNFRDPGRSARWNPLRSVRSEGEMHDVAYKVCTLVDKGGEREGAFWLNNSIDALTAIGWALVQDPREQASLARARQVAALPIAEFARFADAHPSVPGLHRLWELYNDAHQTGACVFQDLRMRLSTFLDERVAQTTSGGPGELDLDDLLRGGGVLVLEVNETDVGKLKQVLNLFINHLFTRLIALAAESPDGRLPCPCSLFLDEFASAVGRIDEMEVRLNTLRERGVSVVAAVQSLSQLNLYGTQAPQVLAGFASKLFFAGLDWSDAEYASRLAGVTTVAAGPEAEAGEALLLPYLPAARPLLLPEEVARPVKHPAFGPPATLFLPETPPVQLYLRPAYDLPLLAGLLGERSRPG
jgi:type IV secretory pathway TraG/TraD family ATPase VirD4